DIPSGNPIDEGRSTASRSNTMLPVPGSYLNALISLVGLSVWYMVAPSADQQIPFEIDNRSIFFAACHSPQTRYKSPAPGSWSTSVVPTNKLPALSTAPS